MVSAAESIQVQVDFADQQEANPIPVWSNHTNIVSGGAKAAPTGEAFKAIPKSFDGVLRPNARTIGRIVVRVIADATDILESEESQWELPMLVYDLSGNLVTRKVLTQENMTGFTQAGTVDITATAGVPQRVAVFDVPRGLAYAIDPNSKGRFYFGDDTA